VRILAFDPGPSTSGWALVGCYRIPRVDWVDGGTCLSTVSSVRELIAKYAPDLVAVERIEGISYDRKRDRKLFETSDAAGRMAAACEVSDVETVRLAAETWRHMLCGNGRMQDKQIARVLKTLTNRMPTRSNVHIRDALGLAIAAFWLSRMTAAQRELVKGGKQAPWMKVVREGATTSTVVMPL
jgi:Holliday junction resolvasome RuvABC endonuclease subunit